MIRRLRRRHRVASVGLALFAPTLLVAALAVRPEMPRGELPFELQLPTEPGRALLVDDVVVRYWIEERYEIPYLILKAEPALEHPDVLAYATAEPPPRGGSLPADAVLLGPVGPPLLGGLLGMGRLDEAPDATHFLLFSLPHQEVLGSAPL